MIFSGGVRLGLDLGGSSVKVVAIKNTAARIPVLVGVGYASLPQGCVVDGVISDPRTAAGAVRAACAQAGVRRLQGVPASVGLRGSSVMTRRLLLPDAPSFEMAGQVFVEAQQHLDSDVGEWALDHQILDKRDAAGQVSVLVAAAKLRVLEEYTALLNTLRLAPVAIDFDLFALGNGFEQAFGALPVPILLLDIGQDSAKLYLVRRGLPVLMRSLALGGAYATQLIDRRCAMEHDEAEAAKLHAVDKNHPAVLECLEQYAFELCEETRKAADFFFQEEATATERLDAIVLSGGGSLLPGLAGLLSQQFCVQVELATPFFRAPLPRPYQGAAAAGHLYAVAMGLAMRFAKDRAG